MYKKKKRLKRWGEGETLVSMNARLFSQSSVCLAEILHTQNIFKIKKKTPNKNKYP